MLPHKLLLDDVEEDFHLLAIHSSLEEYKMAFFLNKNLQFKLKRARFDVDFNHGAVQAQYPLYEFKEPARYRNIYLIKNKYQGPVKKIVSSGSLFVDEEVSALVTHLIPEYKEVDYFLKIEEDADNKTIQQMISKISIIPNVLTTYSVDQNQLKSRNNLIIE